MSDFTVVKALRGAGKVYRARPHVLPPNGGRSPVLVMVEHIPVMHDKPGTEDFTDLARVLLAQGLSLEAATDGDGNVCLYNRLDVLCYQARGLNGPSCGVEHMHMSIGDPWRRVQLRASAWLWQYAEREYGIPMQMAKLGRRPGQAVVLRKGHTSHRRVSEAAAFNDRSDPGPGYDWEYVMRAAAFYKRHGGFTIRRDGKTVGV